MMPSVKDQKLNLSLPLRLPSRPEYKVLQPHRQNPTQTHFAL